MSLLRWKSQSLQFYRYITGSGSKSAQQGLLPIYAQLAFTIASSAGAVAGLAKKTWVDNNRQAMPIDRVRSYRSKINDAFDKLEAILQQKAPLAVSAISPENQDQAKATFEKHGNFALLALTAMEEASELAIPLMQVADGSKTLIEAKPLIDFETADVRVNLHIISEKASVCPEKTTALKWMLVRENYPSEAFEVPPIPKKPAAKTEAEPELSLD